MSLSRVLNAIFGLRLKAPSLSCTYRSGDVRAERGEDASYDAGRLTIEDGPNQTQATEELCVGWEVSPLADPVGIRHTARATSTTHQTKIHPRLTLSQNHAMYT